MTSDMEQYYKSTFSRSLDCSMVMLGLTWLVAACSGPTAGDIVCTLDEPGNAIEVQFTDAVTDDLLTGLTPGAIHDGEYIDSLKPASYDSLWDVVGMGAGKGRAGIYTLTADREGYQPYRKAGIGVRKGSCGVLTRGIIAKLQPE